MFTARSSLKWRNLLRLPRASLCVDKREPPYAAVSLHGDVEEVDRPLYDLVLGMALRYYGGAKGAAFADRYKEDTGRTVVFRLRPVGVSSFGLE